MSIDSFRPSRRGFLGLASGAGLLALGAAPAAAARVKTSAKILILGAGAAGTALANRLMTRLEGAEITLLDGRAKHWYQPGFTLIAAGLKPATYSVSENTDWLPRDVKLVEAFAAEIDPEAKSVTTSTGEKLSYDYLVVATGLKLDWEAIEGFSTDLIGKNGIGAVYAGPQEAAATWAEMDRFTSEGGKAVFFRPATEMKCAGAPLKYTFLTEDYATKKGNRGKIAIEYWNNSKALFGVPIVAEKVRMLFEERGIVTEMERSLTAIDPAKKILTFTDQDGITHETDYDFTNIIPPQRAPDVIRNSPLPWADKWVDQGWVEVDPRTLRHNRFPEVFALGDVAGVPKGKTAASVKWQVPVVEDYLVSDIEGKEGSAAYNG